MTTGASFARGSSKQDCETPPDFIAAVKKKFGRLHLDLAATEKNEKADLWLGPGSDISEDSPSFDWRRWQQSGNLWLNPPFDNIAPWAKKCSQSACDILFLVPASVGSNWFRDYVDGHARVFFVNGRIHFDPNNPTWGYPKDCLLAAYGLPIGYEVWNWKEKQNHD